MNISRCLADGELDEEMGEEEEEEEDMDTTVEVGQCLVPMATYHSVFRSNLGDSVRATRTS